MVLKNILVSGLALFVLSVSSTSIALINSEDPDEIPTPPPSPPVATLLIEDISEDETDLGELRNKISRLSLSKPLGVFVGFPDSILYKIMGYLNPIDLCFISCVNEYLRVKSHSAPLWIDLCSHGQIQPKKNESYKLCFRNAIIGENNERFLFIWALALEKYPTNYESQQLNKRAFSFYKTIANTDTPYNIKATLSMIRMRLFDCVGEELYSYSIMHNLLNYLWLKDSPSSVDNGVFHFMAGLDYIKDPERAMGITSIELNEDDDTELLTLDYDAPNEVLIARKFLRLARKNPNLSPPVLRWLEYLLLESASSMLPNKNTENEKLKIWLKRSYHLIKNETLLSLPPSISWL